MFHYKIVRHCLMTFEIVGEFVRDIDRNCKFCRTQPETIQHLLWDCPIVQIFIRNVNAAIMENYPLYYSHWNKRNFIFSDQGSNILLPHNIFALYLKYYLWMTRCNEEMPFIEGFCRFFNFEINIIKTAFRQKSAIDRLKCINLDNLN